MKNVLIATKEPSDAQFSKLLNDCNKDVISKMKKFEKKFQEEFAKAFKSAKKSFLK